MDAIRAEETTFNIHKIHPNKPEMIFGLASTLALKGNADEAIEQIERGLPLSIDEKQRAATRAALCFLYVRAGYQKYTSWHGKCMR